MEQIVAGQAAAYDVEASLRYDKGYPATVNDAAKVDFAADVAREISGVDAVNADTGKEMGAEDFAYMEVRTGHIAGIPARLLRVGFVGELGYEVHVPSICN